MEGKQCGMGWLEWINLLFTPVNNSLGQYHRAHIRLMMQLIKDPAKFKGVTKRGESKLSEDLGILCKKYTTATSL